EFGPDSSQESIHLVGIVTAIQPGTARPEPAPESFRAEGGPPGQGRGDMVEQIVDVVHPVAAAAPRRRGERDVVHIFGRHTPIMAVTGCPAVGSPGSRFHPTDRVAAGGYHFSGVRVWRPAEELADCVRTCPSPHQIRN